MVTGDLLLVGSIPLDTPEQVFRRVGAALGPYLAGMPDGEVGDRRYWIERPRLPRLQRSSGDRNAAPAGARPLGARPQFPHGRRETLCSERKLRQA
jgi:hypothetical protein